MLICVFAPLCVPPKRSSEVRTINIAIASAAAMKIPCRRCGFDLCSMSSIKRSLLRLVLLSTLDPYLTCQAHGFDHLPGQLGLLGRRNLHLEWRGALEPRRPSGDYDFPWRCCLRR